MFHLPGSRYGFYTGPYQNAPTKGAHVFSEEELEYLISQLLLRLATVDADGQPTVDAVGYEFEEGRFYIGGLNLPATRKYKNVASGNHKVSLIVDDLKTVSPWRPRGIRASGMAEIVERRGRFGPAEYLCVTPAVSWSWGIEEREDFRNGKFTPKKVAWNKQQDDAEDQ